MLNFWFLLTRLQPWQSFKLLRIVHNVPIQKSSFSKSKSSMSSLLLFSVLVAQSISSFQLIQHFVYRILCNMLNKSYLVCGVCEISSDFNILFFVAKHSYRVNKVQHKMIYGQESFYRSHIFSCNNCKQDLDLFLLMVLYCKDQHAPLYP